MVDHLDFLGRCGLIAVDEEGANFNLTEQCGEVCGGNYLGTTIFYCQKGEKCCPSGPFERSCSRSCGPYNTKRKYISNFY